MIGLGIWEIPVNSMFYKGTVEITVKNKDGEYDFSFYVPGFNVPEMDISNVVVIGSTLSADATCEMLRGKNLHVDVDFDGDTCRGAVKGPMGVKIKLNGTRKPE